MCFSSQIFTQSYHVYFGNLDSHTGFSDGSEFPEDAYVYAHNVARIDFLAFTEHYHKSAQSEIARNHDLYSGNQSYSIISVANQFNQDGSLIN